MAGEDWVPITDDQHWEAVEVYNAIKECPGDRDGGVGVASAMKYAYLEKRLTTVKLTDFPPTLGSPSIKSIEISAHT